jgi:curved DNA-binding protein CbpA
VRHDATPAQLRQAYRRKALDAHPDRRDDSAADTMAAINEAWNVLGNPARRAEYDRTLAPPPPRRAPPPPAHARAVAVGPDVEADDPEPNWVDLTPQMRQFRRLLTATLVLGGLFILLVFWLIIWPETA